MCCGRKDSYVMYVGQQEDGSTFFYHKHAIASFLGLPHFLLFGLHLIHGRGRARQNEGGLGTRLSMPPRNSPEEDV